MYQEALDAFRLQMSRVKLSVVTSFYLKGYSQVLDLNANVGEVYWFVLKIGCLGMGHVFFSYLKGAYQTGVCMFVI